MAVRLPGGPVAAAGPVTLGVRPEAASLAHDGIRATVALVEQLGAESHVICTLADGTRVVVRQDHRAVRPDLGEAVGVRIDPAQVHLFDAESGARLELGR
jgi:multiple sugar transport system ATP-binding protein